MSRAGEGLFRKYLPKGITERVSLRNLNESPIAFVEEISDGNIHTQQVPSYDTYARSTVPEGLGGCIFAYNKYHHHSRSRRHSIEAIGLAGSPDRNAFSPLLRMIASTICVPSANLRPSHIPRPLSQGALDRNYVGLDTFVTICRIR